MTAINTTVTKKSKQTIHAADFWCGAGGTSTGLIQSMKDLGYDLELTVVNHWEMAVATHSANHPQARHFCKAVESINPLDIYENRRLHLLVASPECVHHSKARGGKPRDEQKRADVWDIQRWIEKLYIENLLIENVEEFVQWGPLDENNDPIPELKGVFFKQFISWLKVLYSVKWQVLNCADYGDATTRKRFFLMAKRGKRKKIFFPAPTHASRDVLQKMQAETGSTHGLLPWVPARSIIDWSLEGNNIFGRDKPLVENTMNRIFAGLKKHSGIDVPVRTVYKIRSMFSLFSKKKAQEFLKKAVSEGRSFIELDAGTYKKRLAGIKDGIFPEFERLKIDGQGKIVSYHHEPDFNTLDILRQEKQTAADAEYVVSPIKIDLDKFNPFVVGVGGTTGQQAPRDLDRPLNTVLTNNRQGVAEPFIVNMKGEERRMRSVDEPTFTQTTSPRQQYLCEPYVVNLSHTKNNDAGMCKSLDNPIPTICGKGMLGMVQPVLIKYHGNEESGYSVDAPLSTVTTRDRQGLAEPFLVKLYGGLDSDSLDKTLGTVTANFQHYGLAEPFIVKLKKNQHAQSVDEPVPTVTTCRHIAVAQPYLVCYHSGKMDGGIKRSNDLGDPLPTLDTSNRYAVVQPFIVPCNHGSDERTNSLETPMPTITGVDALGFAEPFLIQFYGEREGQEPRTRSIDEPVWTVTPQVRMGIVEPFLVKIEQLGTGDPPVHGLLLLELGAILIINYRMLDPKELAAAMSFPPDYYFAGDRDDQVKQIGNAVPVKTAKALVKSFFAKNPRRTSSITKPKRRIRIEDDYWIDENGEGHWF